jgi:hypothetical protein
MTIITTKRAFVAIADVFESNKLSWIQTRSITIQKNFQPECDSLYQKLFPSEIST